LNHLEKLENESIYILREAATETSNSVLMYSIGKDSSVLLHLARKAFLPEELPFPLLHIDTKWKFKEMISFREQLSISEDIDMLVWTNPKVDEGISPFHMSAENFTNIMKTQALKQALEHWQFGGVIGGARRDEEASRSKEKIFSFRNQFHHWDPKKQRPEFWNHYNCKINKKESLRIFPLSNWSELDIWLYIYKEKIPVVPLYFSQKRPVVNRDGLWFLVDDERFELRSTEKIELKNIRFRTLGCYPLTAGIESNAQNVEEIIEELLNNSFSEREGRVIDFDIPYGMESKKREGYF
ncbi:MAG: sulfate adenylyltransferase subunit CysD, partial [bacterium]